MQTRTKLCEGITYTPSIAQWHGLLVVGIASGDRQGRVRMREHIVEPLHCDGSRINEVSKILHKTARQTSRYGSFVFMSGSDVSGMTGGRLPVE